MIPPKRDFTITGKLQVYDAGRVRRNSGNSEHPRPGMGLAEPTRQSAAGEPRSRSCTPVREETPDLERLYQRFQAQGLVELAISGDQAADLLNYVAEQTITFPLLVDPMTKSKSGSAWPASPRFSSMTAKAARLAKRSTGLPPPGSGGWPRYGQVAGQSPLGGSHGAAM